MCPARTGDAARAATGAQPETATAVAVPQGMNPWPSVSRPIHQRAWAIITGPLLVAVTRTDIWSSCQNIPLMCN